MTEFGVDVPPSLDSVPFTLVSFVLSSLVSREQNLAIPSVIP